eukprot:GFKZ01000307.1.p1 GENE.GFKZ01000307.1~~GFKZ01000307.1.p1  ORF type:complete len:406 (+),score=106.67 GFKZ01000307.1:179-1219(+)
MPAPVDKPDPSTASNPANHADADKPAQSDHTPQPPQNTTNDKPHETPVPKEPTAEEKPSDGADAPHKPEQTDQAPPPDGADVVEKPKAEVANADGKSAAMEDDDDAEDADYDVNADMAAAAAEEEGEEKEAGAEGEDGKPEDAELTAEEPIPKLPKGLVKSLLADGTLGDKPLHNAAGLGDVEKVKQMLDGEFKGDVNDLDVYWYTPLHTAAEKGQAEMCRVLVAAGGDLASGTKMYGLTALHYAAMGGHEEVVKTLLELGAEIDAVTQDLRSPLYLAAMKGHMNCVKILLAQGADIEMKATDGKTAVDAAASPEIADAIKEGPPAKKRKVDAENTKDDAENETKA